MPSGNLSKLTILNAQRYMVRLFSLVSCALVLLAGGLSAATEKVLSLPEIGAAIDTLIDVKYPIPLDELLVRLKFNGRPLISTEKIGSTSTAVPWETGDRISYALTDPSDASLHYYLWCWIDSKNVAPKGRAVSFAQIILIDNSTGGTFVAQPSRYPYKFARPPK